ncbi:MAG: ABC transporter permease [Sphaerochaetaceae bacterium]
MKKLIFNYQSILFLVLILLIIVFGILEPVFFYPEVMFDVTAIIGEIGIMALAMTFVITTGGIDLSVGYIMQLSGISFGSVFATTGNLFFSIIVALLVGTACGIFNGLVIVKTKIPPIIATLATMNLFRGISFIIAGTDSFTGFPDIFKKVFTYEIFGFIPISFIYLLILFAFYHIAYSRGRMGRTLKGIGFNESSLIFSGINTKNSIFISYALSGVMSGFAAMVYLGRLSAARTSMGDGLNLQVITAVVLGGTSTMGGVGSVFGTLIGALIIGVLRKGFTLLNFSGNIFNFTLGMLLIVSLIVFAMLEQRDHIQKAKVQKN